ncbi:Ktr system potassium transporter B [Paracoccus aurantiacus]|uniref:Ktr system potassium transporter B n=1 Tax=Paracoccus aurantiacus TaxID=2599412 RepID=A0A5C6S539_9RHOB|nr:potassium transporter TrkG [Paracoccus aurantiacus]TXB69377.1 Ktr system potassium transporter B [Paracoccus aurantiacus]
MRRAQRLPPPAVLALLYLALVLAGSVAFLLPAATTQPISVMDAIFTSTSAVTVTGLSVIDIQTGLTFWGQLILLLLVQLGGLGLMSFAVLILSALGMPIGIRHQTYLREDLNQTSFTSLTKMVGIILRVVLLAELAGTALLCLVFVPEFGVKTGVWHAAFHAVSAFNNAGFSTFSTGLVPYATDPIINLVIPALFIIGGIGYVVLSDIRRRKFWTGWGLHTRLMVVGSLVLIFVGVTLTAVLEWQNPRTLAVYPAAADRLMVAWFQGVTPRTAGFATTDMAGLHDSTALLFMALMVIGGGPTSTAGGMKVTTVMVMFLATLAFFRRRTEIWAFGRSIGLDEVLKVMALIAIAAVLNFAGIFLIAATHDGDFLNISFEVASAFGNAGLTREYTDDLSTLGRVVIMVMMFLGRVGPLTLGFFLATRTTPRVRYPEGQVHLG